jgi:hypothetical protein
MKSIVITILCLCVSWTVERGFAQSAQAGTIQGHVFRQDGSTISGAEVEIHPFAAIEGILPPPAVTDEHGFFQIVFPAVGQAWVTASKIKEGYPNAALALYGRGGYDSLKQVDLKAGEVVNVDLRFREPNATIEFVVVSAVSRHSVENARILIELTDDPDAMVSTSVSRGGIFDFVLPRRAVAVTISAPGYSNWYFHNEKSGSRKLLAKVGTQIRVKAVLRPAHGH